jgi:hypothetical protein
VGIECFVAVYTETLGAITADEPLVLLALLTALFARLYLGAERTPILLIVFILVLLLPLGIASATYDSITTSSADPLVSSVKLHKAHLAYAMAEHLYDLVGKVGRHTLKALGNLDCDLHLLGLLG